MSILGTGVGVFQGALAERKYPFEGAWSVRVYAPASKAFLAEHQAVLIYSQSNESYWGYSEITPAQSGQSEKAIAVEVVSFEPQKPRVTLRLQFADGKQTVLEKSLISEQKGIRFQSPEGENETGITLACPR